ncbi:MAG: hypothetical protein GY816_04230, partial [Cytophagales bacterium]|nr:hypothetical protein [Cytophagales bacterium]
QKDDQGRFGPIAYASSGLSRDQQKYGPTEIEALACVYAVWYLHTYIFGCEVTLLTDHNSLTFLMHQKQPIPRLQRWILTLDQYRINWVYRKGSSNAVADALSHRYATAEESEQAQSKLIQCDAIVCHTQAGALFRLCFANWKLDEIVTRSKTRQKQIEIVPQVPLQISMDGMQKQNSNLSPLELPKNIPREKVREKDMHKHHPDIPRGIVMRKDVREHQLDTWVSPKNSEIQKSQEKDDELSPIIE